MIKGLIRTQKRYGSNYNEAYFSPVFPYLFGNTKQMTIENCFTGSQILKRINNPETMSYLEDVFQSEYSKFLHGINSKNFSLLFHQTEYSLFKRIKIASVEMEKQKKQLTLLNRASQVNAKILHGKYIIGGYISRKKEREAKLLTERKKEKETIAEAIRYASRAIQYREDIDFIINLTAEIYTKQKLCQLSDIKYKESESTPEYHYLTIEGVIFNANTASRMHKTDIGKINKLEDITVVDFDYMLKGNPHKGEKALALNLPK